MPRRKGHGISPAKRSQANKDDQAKKKASENNEEPVVGCNGSREPEPQEVRYLHKKFKKLAEAALEEAEGGGRYTCPYCRLVCAKPSVLQKHVRAHTGERPYPCRPCGFAFKTRSNLYKHCRSRAHSLKMEIGDAGAPQPPSGDSADEGDGRTAQQSERSEPDSASPGLSVSPSPSPAGSMGSGGGQPPTAPTPARHIYKPKFHKAALYQQQQEGVPSPGSASESPPSPALPSQSTVDAVIHQNTPPSPMACQGSSPSPDVITRHISNIISHNQQVVACSWPKKMHLQRQQSQQQQQLQEQSDHSSRLAAALLRPNRPEGSSSDGSSSLPPTPEPASSPHQPLNLSARSTSRQSQQQLQQLPKSPAFETLMRENGRGRVTIPSASAHPSLASGADSSAALRLLDDLAAATSKERAVDNSIIKTLLLNRRAAAERQDDDSFHFVCPVCRIPFSSAENLQAHQLYYCSRLPKAASYLPPLEKTSLKVDVRAVAASVGDRVAPPFPSPGPLLGSTPLVDSYRPDEKRRRLDAHGPDQPSSPRPNSLQMFGGEVQILDAGGEMKTLRIEPSSSRGASGSGGASVTLAVGHTGGGLVGTVATEPGQPPPHIVVTIARSGLHSGGTLVQLPTTTSAGSAGMSGSRPPRSSGGGVVSPRPVPSPRATPSPTMFPAARLVTPNIAPPDLAVPGIPPPGRALPFPVAYPAFLNPLTHITAYNPLTLPPPPPAAPVAATVPSAAQPSGGVVTIQYGGKTIPHVPGIPGPQTLLLRPLDLVTTSDGLPDQSSPKLGARIPPSTSPDSLRRRSREESARPPPLGPPPPLHPAPLASPPKKVPKVMPSIRVDATDSSERVGMEESLKRILPSSTSPVRKYSRGNDSPLLVSKFESSVKESVPKTNGSESSKCSDNECGGSEGGGRARFLRPTSLPLKPGTFTPKKVHGTGLTPVLPLISPETPRPKKSYGQLYLNGHAYTYLGLKCSARSYYCTLNRPQPMYVPHNPEHPKLSMYSNWKVCSEASPNPLGLDPGKAMALYDSRHRPKMVTVAVSSQKHSLIVTHSSYWIDKSMRQLSDKQQGSAEKSVTEGIQQTEEETDPGKKTDDLENSITGEQPPKRVKIFDGGFESNEEYTYVRGRGRGRYVCEECGIRCKKPSMLKKHIRTHTDVRPFTCKHCSFSFKTKGNLTKHMKSKAHYKKCMEMGIVPVPTVVDESYIDEECLARQQAMRASQTDDGDTDSEDNDEDDDDDDEDEDDDDEEQMPVDEDCEDEVHKGAPEREAARSLLSLSRGREASTLELATAGLVPSVPCRPSTYPYTAATVPPTPHTPTLSAVSAQTEREKVSHNTGLAPGLEGTVGSCLVVHSAANRYYFPSSRAATTPQTSAVTVSDISSPLPPTSSSEREGFPVDLSTRAHLQVQIQPSTPVSEILTPVSEPATLLASLCSSADRCPPPLPPSTPAPAEATMLQAYLTERALQDARVKRHQVLRPDIPPPPSDIPATPTTPTAPTVPFVSKPEKIICANELPTSLSDSSVIPPKSSASSLLAESPGISSTSCRSSPSNNRQSSSPPPPTALSVASISVSDNSSSSPAHLRAEFMPPASGPSPSYVSVTEDGRSMCSICNKIFSKPSQLRLHVNIHYFERPFRCESCAVSFRTKGHLQKHERSVSHQNKVSMNSTFGAPTTTNPRPFKCEDCKIAFRIHGHLAKHLRSKMHIMKLECVGKLPFGTYAEMEREGISLNEIDTTDCENSLESLQVLAQRLYEKDPSKLGQWDGERGIFFLPNSHSQLSGGETSSDEGEPLIGYQSPQSQEPLTTGTAASSNQISELTSIPSNQQQRSRTDSSLTKSNKSNSQFTDTIVPLTSASDLRCDEVGSNFYVRGHTKPVRDKVVLLGTQQVNNVINRDEQRILIHQLDDSLSLEKHDGQIEKVVLDVQQSDATRQRRNVISLSPAKEVNKEVINTQNNKLSKSFNFEWKEVSAKDGGCTVESNTDNGTGVNLDFMCNMCKMPFPNKNDLQMHNLITHTSHVDHGNMSTLSVNNSSIRLPTVCGSAVSTKGFPQQRNSNATSAILAESRATLIGLKDHMCRNPVGLKRSVGIDGNDTTGDEICKEIVICSDSFRTSPSPQKASYCSQLSVNRGSENYMVDPQTTKESISLMTSYSVCHMLGNDNCSDALKERNLIDHDASVMTTSKGNCFRNVVQIGSIKVSDPGSDVTSDSRLSCVKWVDSHNDSERMKHSLADCGALCQNEETLEDQKHVENNVKDSVMNNICRSESEKIVFKTRHLSMDSDSGENCGGGDIKFHCDLCGKLQSSKESLQKHMLSHTQMRPFVCEFCDAGFTSQNQLNCHLEMHQQKSTNRP